MTHFTTALPLILPPNTILPYFNTKIWINTIFKIHSELAALTIKEKQIKRKNKSTKKTGRQRNRRVKDGANEWTDGKTWWMYDWWRLGCGGQGSSEVTHVPVICPAGVGPAVHVVTPVSIPWLVSGGALPVPGRPDRESEVSSSSPWAQIGPAV